MRKEEGEAADAAEDEGGYLVWFVQVVRRVFAPLEPERSSPHGNIVATSISYGSVNRCQKAFEKQCILQGIWLI